MYLQRFTHLTYEIQGVACMGVASQPRLMWKQIKCQFRWADYTT